MPKFTKLKEGPNGWTKWQYPIMKNYLLACCDCGLVHTVQLGVFEQLTKETKRHGFKYRVLRKPKFRVRLRAKRNKIQAKLLRKKDGITVTH